MLVTYPRSVTAMAGKATKLYSAWFCPFAQRTWIALLEKGVDFELVEINPYDKTPEFLAVNPLGLVPTLVHNEKSVYESLVTLEYIDEAWPQSPKLMPTDAYGRAQARMWIDFIGKRIVPTYYQILQWQGKDQQEEAKGRLLNNLRTFISAMSSDGPYFFGKEFSLVDIALIPFALRFEVLAHYRSFSLPTDGSFDRLITWMDAWKSRPAVNATIAPTDKLLVSYKRYADDTAESKLADAIRKGTPIP